MDYHSTKPHVPLDLDRNALRYQHKMYCIRNRGASMLSDDLITAQQNNHDMGIRDPGAPSSLCLSLLPSPILTYSSV
jgi:hypothetical protein